MRKYLLAAVAAAAVASPASARDGSPYVGLEGGIVFPETKDINGNATFTDPALTQIGGAPIGRVHFKKGYDVDVIGGYDLGLFRIEGELGYKHSSVKTFSLTNSFIQGLNVGAKQLHHRRPDWLDPARQRLGRDGQRHDRRRR